MDLKQNPPPPPRKLHFRIDEHKKKETHIKNNFHGNLGGKGGGVQSPPTEKFLIPFHLVFN